jgi:hypothetical protein
MQAQAPLFCLQSHLQAWPGQQTVADGLLNHSSMWSLHMHHVNTAVRKVMDVPTEPDTFVGESAG